MYPIFCSLLLDYICLHSVWLITCKHLALFLCCFELYVRWKCNTATMGKITLIIITSLTLCVVRVKDTRYGKGFFDKIVIKQHWVNGIGGSKIAKTTTNNSTNRLTKTEAATSCHYSGRDTSSEGVIIFFFSI